MISLARPVDESRPKWKGFSLRLSSGYAPRGREEEAARRRTNQATSSLLASSEAGWVEHPSLVAIQDILRGAKAEREGRGKGEKGFSPTSSSTSPHPSKLLRSRKGLTSTPIPFPEILSLLCRVHELGVVHRAIVGVGVASDEKEEGGRRER